MKTGYDVSIGQNGIEAMQWHGQAASRGHAEVHARAAYSVARRAAALGAGADIPQDVDCQTVVMNQSQGAMTENWTVTAWRGQGRAKDLIKLPDRVECAVAVAVTSPDFLWHYGRGHEVTANVDIISNAAGLITVKADLYAVDDSGLKYLMRRREAARGILLALGIAHLAAGADVVSEKDHGDASLANLFKGLNDEPKDLLPGQAWIRPQESATLRAVELAALRRRAVGALASLGGFAKAIGEKGTARAIRNRMKEIDA